MVKSSYQYVEPVFHYVLGSRSPPRRWRTPALAHQDRCNVLFAKSRAQGRRSRCLLELTTLRRRRVRLADAGATAASNSTDPARPSKHWSKRFASILGWRAHPSSPGGALSERTATSERAAWRQARTTLVESDEVVRESDAKNQGRGSKNDVFPIERGTRRSVLARTSLVAATIHLAPLMPPLSCVFSWAEATSGDFRLLTVLISDRLSSFRQCLSGRKISTWRIGPESRAAQEASPTCEEMDKRDSLKNMTARVCGWNATKRCSMCSRPFEEAARLDSTKPAPLKCAASHPDRLSIASPTA